MGNIEYAIEIEVIEGDHCDAHSVGDKFEFPADTGRICPWLMDSINSMVRVLQFGGELPWRYTGTPYEKISDPEGITTEFVRCPDPTSAGVVVKITRKKRETPLDVGWA